MIPVLLTFYIIVSYTHCTAKKNLFPFCLCSELSSLPNLKHPCNMDCMCSTEFYEPLCTDDNEVQYFSPCFAGCKKKTTLSGEVRGFLSQSEKSPKLLELMLKFRSDRFEARR